ncbi:MAG TPA: 30S ribosomal protein S20 [Candidatus Polarisedimenticolia bacterium]|jgi:small subunit ribosomal protein S20
MATHQSAIKRHKQSLKRREANKATRSRLRTQIKKLRDSVETSDAASARRLLPETIALIDRSIQKGVVHENTAARYKSRLTRLVNKLGAPK